MNGRRNHFPGPKPGSYIVATFIAGASRVMSRRSNSYSNTADRSVPPVSSGNASR
jgi:hypothetical protein